MSDNNHNVKYIITKKVHMADADVGLKLYILLLNENVFGIIDIKN